MTSKSLLSSAGASIFSWRLVASQLIVPALTWGAYIMAVPLLQGLGITRMPGVDQLVQMVYWGNVGLTVLCLAIASVRSALPAALACVAAAPLSLLGHPTAAAWAPLVGLSAFLLYAIGFAIQAGRAGLAGRA